jgi:hypothetical protein
MDLDSYQHITKIVEQYGKPIRSTTMGLLFRCDDKLHIRVLFGEAGQLKRVYYFDVPTGQLHRPIEQGPASISYRSTPELGLYVVSKVYYLHGIPVRGATE